MTMDSKENPVPLKLFRNEAILRTGPVFLNTPSNGCEKHHDRTQKNEFCVNKHSAIKTEPEHNNCDRDNGDHFENGIKREIFEENYDLKDDNGELLCPVGPSLDNSPCPNALPFSKSSQSNNCQINVSDQGSSSESDVDIETIPDMPHLISTLMSNTALSNLPISSTSKRRLKSICTKRKRYIANKSVHPGSYVDQPYDACLRGLDSTTDFHNYAKPLTLSNKEQSLVNEKTGYDKQMKRNNLERCRRRALNDLFEDLSKEIPVFSHTKLNSKRLILSEAVSYILSLQIYLQSQNDTIIEESKKNLSMRETLQYLQLQSYPMVFLDKL